MAPPQNSTKYVPTVRGENLQVPQKTHAAEQGRIPITQARSFNTSLNNHKTKSISVDDEKAAQFHTRSMWISGALLVLSTVQLYYAYSAYKDSQGESEVVLDAGAADDDAAAAAVPDGAPPAADAGLE